jgi:hypothetical protein
MCEILIEEYTCGCRKSEKRKITCWNNPAGNARNFPLKKFGKKSTSYACGKYMLRRIFGVKKKWLKK